MSRREFDAVCASWLPWNTAFANVPPGPKYPPSMATGNSDVAAPCTTPFGDEATTVGRTGIRVKVNCPPAVVVTGWPGSVTETVYVKGVADPPGTPAKSTSSNRTRAPLEGGGVLPAGGTGKRNFT